MNCSIIHWFSLQKQLLTNWISDIRSDEIVDNIKEEIFSIGMVLWIILLVLGIISFAIEITLALIT